VKEIVGGEYMLNIENMSKKKQYLYNGMWGNKNFDFPVVDTKVSGGKISSNSYSFEGASTISGISYIC
jgi:hypothetical protein